MSFFGGKDPFDDPFFTSPFGSIFGRKNLFDDPFFPHPFDGKSSSERQLKEIAIEELNSDDNTQKHSSENPIITFPSENASGNHTFSFQRVAYGGPEGMYYTSSMARASTGDGVVLLETKEEDKTMGQSLHTVSKGIKDKGLSLTKKHNSDGKVDTLQTLHNLNEDELSSFDGAWKSNVQRYFPGWDDKFSLLEYPGSSSGWNGHPTWGGWALPSAEHLGDAKGMKRDTGAKTLSSGQRAKKVVRVDIE
ncbi:uncharacterized protein LOC132299111 isoform X2 [Cornus florida]|uniref:uncharacterized protein LOC132299111 isoform X2 n=1 Tax=Cornus florida TaxID=4283 RepID=UPI0028A00A28|nr:uncharacterized protein LOC132299111 isoform X2 [Cornus florida]